MRRHNFDEKLKIINRKLKKARHVVVEKKLDNLSEKVKLISIKELSKGLI